MSNSGPRKNRDAVIKIVDINFYQNLTTGTVKLEYKYVEYCVFVHIMIPVFSDF